MSTWATVCEILAELPAVASEELRERLVDDWRLIAPKRVVREFLET